MYRRNLSSGAGIQRCQDDREFNVLMLILRSNEKMKNFYSLLFLIFLTASCREKMPLVDCLTCEDDNPATITPQDRRVLIEEFTGVRCVQCPQGSLEIKNLKSIYGERLVAVSIHAGSLANPYSQSQYDFRTDEGENLLNFLGIPEGFPTGVINRKLFPGQPDLQLETAGAWAGRIVSELEIDALITLDIENTWNETDRSLQVHVIGGAIDRIGEEIKLTVLITESNITDTQMVPLEGIIDDYVHNHVLRKSLTAFDGDIIATSLNVGEFIDEEYAFSLPENWKAENCNVIAFVHLTGADKLVLQAVEKQLTE